MCIKNLILLILSVLLFWGAKSIALYNTANILLIPSIYIINIFVIYILLYLNKQKNIVYIWLFSFCCSLVFAPDTLSIFSFDYNESFFLALGFTLFLGVSISLFISLFRYILIYLSIILLNKMFSNYVKTLVIIILPIIFNIVELSYFYIFPALHAHALATPFYVGFEQKINTSKSKNVLLLINTNMSDIERYQLLYLNKMDIFVNKLQSEILKHKNDLINKNVYLLFPETFFSIKSEDINLIDIFFEQSKQYFITNFNAHLFMFSGVTTETSNYIYYAGKNKLNHKVINGVFYNKQQGVPFFEQNVFGFSWLKFIYKNYNRTFLEKSEEIYDKYNLYMPKYFININWQICFEALNGWHWQKNIPTIVFTNHVLFSKYLVMSKIYDYELKLLSSLYHSPLFLVSNKGETGIFYTSSIINNVDFNSVIISID